MKKSNIFMLAYIVFIFIVCFFQKNTGTDVIGTRIILAVTSASYFFATADFFCCIAEDKDGTANIELHRGISIKQSINKTLVNIKAQHDAYDSALKFLEENIDKDSSIKKTYLSVNNCYPSYSSIESDLQEMYNTLSKMMDRIESRKKKIKIYMCLSDILMFLGFLGFLCILAFEVFSALLLPDQNDLTVFAFGFIMLNYFLKDVFLTKRTQERLAARKLIEEFDSLSLNIEKQNALIDTLNKSIIEVKNLLKDATNLV